MIKLSLQILLIFSYSATIFAIGIDCYRCVILPTGKPSDRLCSEFDGSSQYQVHCPNSTLCRKRTIVVPIKDGQVLSVLRDCTPQKKEQHEWNSKDRKWHSSIEIDESAYEEGCFSGPNKGRPGKPAEYCYCSTYLCNKSSSDRKLHFFLDLVFMGGIIFSIYKNVITWMI